jgi:hypothetical protein
MTNELGLHLVLSDVDVLGASRTADPAWRKKFKFQSTPATVGALQWVPGIGFPFPNFLRSLIQNSQFTMLPEWDKWMHANNSSEAYRWMTRDGSGLMVNTGYPSSCRHLTFCYNLVYVLGWVRGGQYAKIHALDIRQPVPDGLNASDDFTVCHFATVIDETGKLWTPKTGYTFMPLVSYTGVLYIEARWLRKVTPDWVTSSWNKPSLPSQN